MTEDKNKYILSINGMSKSFGRNKVLKHISMNVKPGTIMGLMGENGAGKSTMMKCLFGTYQKDEGTIVLDGKEVNFSGPKDALENGVAMVHQELNQCLERSVPWKIPKEFRWSDRRRKNEKRNIRPVQKTGNYS